MTVIDYQINKLLCLNKVQSDLISRDGSYASILKKLVTRLAVAFDAVDNLCVSILCNEGVATEGLFFEPFHSIRSQGLHGRVCVEVFACGEGNPYRFSRGERILVDEVAAILELDLERYYRSLKQKYDELPWQAFFDSFAEGVMLVSPDGNVIFYNQVAETLLQMRPGTMRGKNIAHLLKGAMLESGASFFSSGEQVASENMFSRLDSVRISLSITDGQEPTWFSLSSRAFATGGRFQGSYIVSLRDIGFRKKAEQEMQLRVAQVQLDHALFETVLDVLPVGVVIVDEAGTIVRENTEFQKNWNRGRFSHQRLLEKITVKTNEVAEYHSRGVSSGSLPDARSAVVDELDISDEHKDVRHALLHSAPFYRRPGELAGTVSVVVDVTQIKRQQVEMQRLLALLNASNDAIIGLSSDGTIVHWNRGAEKMYGYLAEEIMGQHVRVLSPEGSNGMSDEELLGGNGEQKAWSDKDVIRLNKDNTLIHVSQSLSVFTDRKGGVVGYSSIERDIRPRKELERKFRHDAMHDSLTGLPNRAVFMDHVEKAFARSERTNELFSVLVVDVDDFKLVNDTLGHLAGDALLVQVSRRILHCLRPVDTLARYGGDEFTILLESVGGISVIESVVERIIEQMQREFYLFEKSITASLSIGVAVWNARYMSVSDIIRDADKALYDVKANGKANYKIFDQVLREASENKTRLIKQLMTAVSSDQFVVNYQAVVELTSNRVVSAESLVRWSPPGSETLYPKDFMFLAEEAGVMVDVGKLVLSRAIELFSQWLRCGVVDQSFCLTINVSSSEILSRDYRSHLVNLLSQYDISADMIMLEVSERLFMAHQPFLIKEVNSLKNYGVGLCLDNFGSELSSLQLLQELDVDLVKFDRSYINNLCDPVKKMVIESLLQLAAKLGIRVVAEGVDTPKKLQQVVEAGFEYAQGNYLFEASDGATAESYIKIPGDEGSVAV